MYIAVTNAREKDKNDDYNNRTKGPEGNGKESVIN